MRHAILLLALLGLVSSATASSGDRLPEFQSCIARCSQASCTAPEPLPFVLRLTRWTCDDDCKYHCTHLITDFTSVQHGHTHQFYGKWPFWRLGGMQEPASVAFSLANLVVHARAFRRIRRRIPRSHPVRPYLLTWAAVSINAWVWSTVFHIRDTPRTERLDYFSAALAILTALHFLVSRLFFLPSISHPRSPIHTVRFRLWTVSCVIAYIAHVTYLNSLPRFDYTYNVTFNLVVAALHHILWLCFSLPARFTLFSRFPRADKLTSSPINCLPRTYRPPYASRAAFLILLTCGATSLELLDFPAIGRVVDAHALWHFSTVPLGVAWYHLVAFPDAFDPGWRGLG